MDLSNLSAQDSEVYSASEAELRRQRESIELLRMPAPRSRRAGEWASLSATWSTAWTTTCC